MGHIIESAKSGRAKCRKCKKSIVKGELRFGHEVVNAFSSDGDMTYQWYHLECGAGARPAELTEAIKGFDGEIPDQANLEKKIAAGKKKVKPSKFPYAEKAPSGRSTCIQCNEKIAKGEYRVAVEREIDTGSFVTTGAGYLHPMCALEYVDDSDGLMEEVRANSTSLEPDELEELSAALD
jgi:hypothetical protein